MKKFLLLIVLFTIVFPASAQKIVTKIKKMDIPVTYNAAKYDSVTEISYKQMQKDVEEFCYLIETCYAGYDDAVNNGLDIEDAKQKIISKYNKNQKIKVDDLSLKIYEQFSPYIKDYHAYIGKENVYRFIIPTLTYFTNTYVTKENEKLYIFQTDRSELQKGDEITCNEKLLFYYPAKGENVYRIGCLSKKNISLITVKKDDDSILLPLKVVRSENNGFEYYTKENESAIYIRYSQCYYNNENEEKMLQAFSNAAELCRNKETIILDIRGNPGGDDSYSNYFFNDLCFYQKDFFNEMTSKNEDTQNNEEQLPMPNTVFSYMSIKSFIQSLKKFVNEESDEWKEIDFVLTQMEKEQKKNPQKVIDKKTMPTVSTYTPLYKGKVIVITDNNVCSSGESIIEQAYKYLSNTRQFFHIGTNTAGCGAYGNICTYYLSNSGCAVCLGITDFTGTQKSVPSFQGEGNGYNPDYWCTKEDIADTVFYITQDEETRDFIKEVLAQ